MLKTQAVAAAVAAATVGWKGNQILVVQIAWCIGMDELEDKEEVVKPEANTGKKKTGPARRSAMAEFVLAAAID